MRLHQGVTHLCQNDLGLCAAQGVLHHLAVRYFRFGDLALLVVEVFSGNEATLTVPEKWRLALNKLWPSDGRRPFLGHPPRSLTDAGLRQSIHIFDPPKPAPKTKRGKPPKRPK